VQYLDDSMSVRELCEVFDQMGHRRDAHEHPVLMGNEVRKYLTSLLRERLGRR
jgi:hypothetical protein